VHPDLGVLGKALANGFPLSAVVGRADLMARVRETWVSSTLATELVSLAAADAVLSVWERTDVAGHIRRIGEHLMDGIQETGSGTWDVQGIPEMWFLKFGDPELERRFLLGCAQRGVLLKRGAYNFPSLVHREREVKTTLGVMSAALEEARA
jgi:glutamate-1-semialdehyde 2,1-aminomutase